MFFRVAYALLLCSGAHGWHPTDAIEGACYDVEGDCELAHTSLLQESVNLLKQSSGHEVEENGQDTDAAGERVGKKQTGAAGGKYSSRGTTSSAAPEATSTAAVVGEGVAVFGAVAVLGFVCYQFLVGAGSSAGDEEELAMGKQGTFLESLVINSENHDLVDIRNEDYFEEDTYQLATALVIRDLQKLATGQCQMGLRISRLVFSVGLIFLTVAIQISILVCTKMLVTPQSVAGIRDSYDKYEQAMYGKHVYVNENGKHRGIVGFLNASAFDGLDDDLKKDVCNIPLSQLGFISLVLLVWAITCMAQLKKCIENFTAIVFLTPTISSMADALGECSDDGDGEGSAEDDEGAVDENGIDDGLPVAVIKGITMPVKVFLTVFVFLPDMLSTGYILWLGSRWLVATNDFGNVVSNAVALEFTLMLKCLLFCALVSERNKRELSHTAMTPGWTTEPAGFAVYFSSTIWAVFAVLWVWFYVHHQAVLPEYKWDVNSFCTPWLQGQLDPDSGD